MPTGSRYRTIRDAALRIIERHTVTRKVGYALINTLTAAREELRRTVLPRPNILSIDETVAHIVANRSSVSRYGDGEFDLILGRSLGFQEHSALLAERLSFVLKSHSDNHLVCLPDIFGGLWKFAPPARRYWAGYVRHYRKQIYACLDMKKLYANSFISRCYIDLADRSGCARYFASTRRIWHEREVVIVEGTKSRLGVGNDLFDNARSIERICVPAENAFARYDAILCEVRKVPRTKLILLAVGPTATVLAYDLHALGYQTIDIGHIDIEYEWFLMGATEKVGLGHKYVNEVSGGSEVAPVDGDANYRSQIIAVVSDETPATVSVR